MILENGRVQSINTLDVVNWYVLMNIIPQELVGQYNTFFSVYVCRVPYESKGGYTWLHLDDFSDFNLAVCLASCWPQCKIIKCTRLQEGIQGEIL